MNAKALHFFSLWRALGIVLLLFVLVVSLWPAEKMPTLPGSDKIHHCITYGILMAYWSQLVSNRVRLAIGLILFGIAIEIAQPRLSNRDAEVMDAVANSIGVGLGWALMFTPLRNAVAWFDEKFATARR